VSRTISATTAAKRFREVLNDVERAGEVFEVERHGRPVARIGPTDRAAASRAVWKVVQAQLTSGPLPDTGFADDLYAVKQLVGRLPNHPWARSSTAQS
jgi:antitoxin (DNA-binding transcriptional repressor) of toxin-antitoxin stability system